MSYRWFLLQGMGPNDVMFYSTVELTNILMTSIRYAKSAGWWAATTPRLSVWDDRGFWQSAEPVS
jgi:hypothetical protein